MEQLAANVTKAASGYRLAGFVKLARPKQWIKNLFVLAALVFSRNIYDLHAVKRAVLAIVCFCLVSSCVYIMNDLVDVEKDIHHPKKKYRPIASGIVKPAEAVIMMLVVLLAGIALAWMLDLYFLLVISLYILNNVLYSFKVKHMVILDVMSIALGFLFRVIGGAVVISVWISPWLLLCTLLLALFLGFSKRRNELVVLEGNADRHRKILDEYSIELIDNMLSIVAASVVIAYSLYTFSGSSRTWMMATIPFILYGIFRYQYIVYKNNEGGSPEEVVLSDKPLMLDILLWMAACVVILYFIK